MDWTYFPDLAASTYGNYLDAKAQADIARSTADRDLAMASAVAAAAADKRATEAAAAAGNRDALKWIIGAVVVAVVGYAAASNWDGK